jgi:hypothetical protein
VVAALDAFVHGRARAQDQNRSDTLDPSVTVSGTPGADAVVELVRILDAHAPAAGCIEAAWSLPDGTTLRGPVALIR